MNPNKKPEAARQGHFGETTTWFMFRQLVPPLSATIEGMGNRRSRRWIAFIGLGIGLMLYAGRCFYMGERYSAAVFFGAGMIQILVCWFMEDRFSA